MKLVTKSQAVLLLLALALLLQGCDEAVVQRAPVEVSDVSIYGDELRGATLNPPEPTHQPEYKGSGHYVRWSHSGALAAVTTYARGYYKTVSVWDEREGEAVPVVSIEDHDPGSGRAFRYAWSGDDKALLIYGYGRVADGGNAEKTTRICMVYMVEEDQLFRILPCEGARWAFA